MCPFRAGNKTPATRGNIHRFIAAQIRLPRAEVSGFVRLAFLRKNSEAQDCQGVATPWFGGLGSEFREALRTRMRLASLKETPPKSMGFK